MNKPAASGSRPVQGHPPATRDFRDEQISQLDPFNSKIRGRQLSAAQSHSDETYRADLATMNPTDYEEEIKAVLEQEREAICEKIQQCFQKIPTKSEACSIVIFTDQDGEGDFSIRMSINGPDLFSLNKAIADTAEVFTARNKDGRLKSTMFDPFDPPFDVKNHIFKSAVQWLQSLFQNQPYLAAPVPLFIETNDGMGMLERLEIKL